MIYRPSLRGSLQTLLTREEKVALETGPRALPIVADDDDVVVVVVVVGC